MKEENFMAEKVKDPVCKMEINKEKAKGPVVHNGTSFYFCCDGCKGKFEKDPEKYSGK